MSQKPNGNLRICLDPTDLNKYIGQCVTLAHWMMLAICSRNVKHFSVFDATKGFSIYQ